MNCYEIQPLLSAYVDRELSADEFRNVTRHLAQCATCETKAASFEGMKSAVSRQPRAGLPLDLRMAIQSQTVGAVRPHGGFSLNWWVPTLVFAAAAGSGVFFHLNKSRSLQHSAETVVVQQSPAPVTQEQIVWHKPDVSSSTLQ